MMVEIIEFERLVRTLNLLKPLNYFLINYFKLGFFITNGRPTNHRTLLKIFLNPYLRLFGYAIRTSIAYKIVNNKLYIYDIKYKFGKQKYGKKLIPDFKASTLKYDMWYKTRKLDNVEINIVTNLTNLTDLEKLKDCSLVRKLDNEFNVELINIDINLVPSNELDNIIYYLICARSKLIESNLPAADLRIDSAYEKFTKLIKQLNQ